MLGKTWTIVRFITWLDQILDQISDQISDRISDRISDWISDRISDWISDRSEAKETTHMRYFEKQWIKIVLSFCCFCPTCKMYSKWRPPEGSRLRRELHYRWPRGAAGDSLHRQSWVNRVSAPASSCSNAQCSALWNPGLGKASPCSSTTALWNPAVELFVCVGQCVQWKEIGLVSAGRSGIFSNPEMRLSLGSSDTHLPTFVNV